MYVIGGINPAATPEHAIAGLITLAVVVLVILVLVFLPARVARGRQRPDRGRQPRQRDAERRFAEAVARGDLQDAETELERVLSH